MVRSVFHAVLVLTVGLGVAVPWTPSSKEAGGEASATLRLDTGETVKLSWKAKAWDAEWVRTLRQDAGARRRANPLLPVQLDIKLETPVGLRVKGIDVAAGTHRVALQMNDAGVLELSLLQDQRFVSLGVLPLEDERKRSHLALSLLPTLRGSFALRFEWGPEWGEVVFHERR